MARLVRAAVVVAMAVAAMVAMAVAAMVAVEVARPGSVPAPAAQTSGGAAKGGIRPQALGLNGAERSQLSWHRPGGLS